MQSKIKMKKYKTALQLAISIYKWYKYNIYISKNTYPIHKWRPLPS